MNVPTEFHFSPKHVWSTIDVNDVGDKFILEERGEHTMGRQFFESAFCVIVGVLFLCSYLLAILPGIPLVAAYPAASIMVGIIIVALALHAFATRGFKRQIGFDKSKKTVWTCNVNSRGHARILTHFPKTDVHSVFVRRPEDGSNDAVLLARVKGRVVPVTLLCGSLKDIEAAHFELCRVLRDVAVMRAVRPVQKANFRKLRPVHLVGACAA
jgi:hypothetical protein